MRLLRTAIRRSRSDCAHHGRHAGDCGDGKRWRGVGLYDINYAEVRDLQVAAGSFIAPQHDDAGSLVAVLGSRVAATLYGGIDPIGQEVRLSFLAGRVVFGFTVIGVLEEIGGAADANDQVFVPITGLADRFRFLYTPTGDLRVTQIDVQTTPGADTEEVKQQVSDLLLFDITAATQISRLRARTICWMRPRRSRIRCRFCWAALPVSRCWSADWRDEHHAGLGDGADSRDRDSTRGGRDRGRHRQSVCDGSAGAECVWRCAGNCDRVSWHRCWSMDKRLAIRR